jgi:hypothetical protein
MSAGVALALCVKFPSLRQIECNAIGSVAIHNIGHRKIYSLITKKIFNDKPNERDFIRSLMALKDICVQDGIRYLAMCKIGCGRDNLDWDKFVLPQIKTIFKMIEIEIHIYHLNN